MKKEEKQISAGKDRALRNLPSLKHILSFFDDQ